MPESPCPYDACAVAQSCVEAVRAVDETAIVLVIVVPTSGPTLASSLRACRCRECHGRLADTARALQHQRLLLLRLAGWPGRVEWLLGCWRAVLDCLVPRAVEDHNDLRA